MTRQLSPTSRGAKGDEGDGVDNGDEGINGDEGGEAVKTMTRQLSPTFAVQLRRSSSLEDLKGNLPAYVVRVLEKLDFNGDGELDEEEMTQNAGLLHHLVEAINSDPTTPPTTQDIEDGIQMLADIKTAQRNNSPEICYKNFPKNVQQVIRFGMTTSPAP